MNLTNVQSISPRELQDMRDRNQFLLLLDVGQPAEYGAMHVDIARFVPIDSLDHDSIMKLGRWSNEVPLVFISLTGRRAKRVCETFRSEGFENVFYLEGGSEAWVAEGRPVTGTVRKRLMKRGQSGLSGRDAVAIQ